MKWSLCSTGNQDKPVEYVLNRVRELGLEGIELWIGHIDDYAERHGSIDGLIEELGRKGVKVPAVSPYVAFSKSDEERERSLAIVEQAAQYAVRFNSPIVRIFLGHLPSAETPVELWEQSMEALRKALAIADRYGVNLGLELHNNTFADTIGSIERIVREANHPRLRLIFDGFNLYLERVDQAEALEALIAYTDHVHMKSYFWNLDEPETRRPTSVFDGDVDNARICRALQRHGYAGFISFEYFGEDGENCVKASVSELRTSGWMK
ncbi:sugar phosphate isomerase/epimerase family protein [Paenibacillus hodogayensis]|uniref:Sugar phosphate isomerase/epimerase family protein n=1 Tax=Paenibacillus hodogayensis TaxID=279208 RepID=A0ABV5W8H3_9BACL